MSLIRNESAPVFTLPSNAPFAPTRDVEAAFKSADAYWPLQRTEVFANPTKLAANGFVTEFQKIPGAVALVRADTTAHIGLVSEAYEPFDNVDVAALVDTMIRNSPEPVLVDSVVTYGNGAGLVVGLQGGSYTVGESRDSMAHRLYLHTRHDGRGGLSVFPMQTRLNCLNQVPYMAGRGVNLRHSADIGQKAEHLTRIMATTWDLAMDFKTIGDTLSSVSVTERTIEDSIEEYVQRAYPQPVYATGSVEDHNARTTRVLKVRATVANDIMHRFTASPAMVDLPYSQWRLLNAITEHEEHATSRGSVNRARVSLDSSRSKRKLLALEVMTS